VLARISQQAEVVFAPTGADIPRLRGAGMAAASGDWVAVTEDHCVPDPRWLEAFAGAAEPGFEVLGGSMGNARRERATDCGAFFSEYGFFGAGGAGARDRAPLITGANVAYHQSIARRVTKLATGGGWENVIHDELFASGARFRLVPHARVRQNLSYSVGPFCRDRYEHGRDYARTRARGLPAMRRMVMAAATPVLPVVLASRVARAVDREERPHFARALPATLTFLSAWAVGEAVGYLTAGRR
jgi:hypothetical protein